MTEVNTDPKRFSNRPKDKPFYQQRLASWNPILTIKSVFPYFLTIGIIFIPLGAVFIVTSNNVHEKSIQYTLCKNAAGDLCSEFVRQVDSFSKYKTCQCTVDFSLESDYTGKVFFYYGLTNFYQNHRIYVRSRDDNQLNGQDVSELSSNCEPFRYATIDNKSVPFAPCGAIASSLFNDTFKLSYKGADGTFTQVPWTNENIAWTSDKTKKFGKYLQATNVTKPIGWPKTPIERNLNSYAGDEELLVWMRTAALPSFRKLHRILKNENTFENGLPKGEYQLSIDYAYPVTQFSGTKQFIITQLSWLGGKNLTLGIAYVTVGIIHLIIGITLSILQYKIQK